MAELFRMASMSFRDLAAVREGREIVGRYSLASLNLLANELDVDPYDLEIAGVVRTSSKGGGMSELAPCETPACGRRVTLPAGYCCSPCSQAHDRHRALTDDQHTPECDARQVRYAAAPSDGDALATASASAPPERGER